MLKSDQESKRISVALKAAKCGFWDWNIVDNTIYFDPNFFLIAGYEPDEFPHHYDEWKKRICPEDIALAEKAIQQYISGEIKTYAVEFRFKTKSGHWMWILDQGGISERDEKGNPLRFSGLHIDISERKFANEKLKKGSDLETTVSPTTLTPRPDLYA